MGLNEREYMMNSEKKFSDVFKNISFPKIFLIIIFAFFLLDNFFFKDQFLFSFNKSLIFEGQIWRLVTSFFLFSEDSNFFIICIELYFFYFMLDKLNYIIGYKEILHLFLVNIIAFNLFLFAFSISIKQIGFFDVFFYSVLLSFIFITLYSDINFIFFIVPIKNLGKNFLIIIFVFKVLQTLYGVENYPFFSTFFVSFLFIEFSSIRLQISLNFPKVKNFFFASFNNKNPYSKQKDFKDNVSNEEVDEILDKILVKGISSLTKEEKETLKKSSKNKTN